MSRSSRHARCLIPTLLAGLTLPLAAHAAAAPTRDYAFDPSGVPVTPHELLGITQDASEVLFTNAEDPTAENLRLLARNLRTNTTTVVLATEDHAVAASADNQVVLYDTAKALDPIDRNGAADLYLLNRRTGASTLVSHTPGGSRAIGDVDALTRALISGDGQTVFFDSQGGGTNPQVLRFDATSRVVSVVGNGALARNQRLGMTGGAVVTTEGIVAGGRTFPVPPPAGGYHRDRRQFRVSDDGRTVADENAAATAESNLAITDTASGVRRPVPLATALGFGNYQLVSVANGGATVTIGASVTNADATTIMFVGRIATTTGAFTQVGPNLPWNPASSQTIVTSDEAFVASATVSALGTKIVPGSPPAPAADALAYVHFYPGCSSGTLFQAAIKATLALDATATGSNPRTPVSAAVDLVNDDGSAGTSFTLTKGTRRQLPKANGGFTYIVKVTFSDGTTSKASNRIGTYAPMRNDTNPFTGARGACKIANGL